MATLAAGVDYLDLHFLGHPNIIATAVLLGPGRVALIDPGPQTTISQLQSELAKRGLSVGDVTDVLLTHIHLDHAGVTGHLVQRNAQVTVFVHERGAPHMLDPSRLLKSAARLYGDAELHRLWGEMLPVPRENVRALSGSETIQAGGRSLRVAYTPGHAKHHVSYFDEASGVAFVGDTAGVRRPPCTYVLPPTPPPDVEVEAWQLSIERILDWHPATLFLTHFGPYDDPPAHLRELIERLRDWVVRARALLKRLELTPDARRDAFVEAAMLDLRRQVGEPEAALYHRAGRLDYSWLGLEHALQDRRT